jgi:RecA-family ATPase
MDAATAFGSELIVVDTLNRAMIGGNENAPEDMGTFIRNVTGIRAYTHAHIAIIHHETKSSDGKNPRGHSSLEGVDDALINVEKRQDGSRIATVVHARTTHTE